MSTEQAQALSAELTSAAPTGPAVWPLDVVALMAGLAALYAPTVYGLMQNDSAGLWSQGEHSHGPIMLTMALWLLHKRWQDWTPPTSGLRGQAWAWPSLALGALAFITGRSLGIIYLEVGSFIPMLMGVILQLGGTPLLARLKFPVFFALFMVPLPGFIIDPVSHFLKERISMAVADLLWACGYPITRTGVVLTIGPYQLLVADACAGMRTLFMLEAMGIFYLNVIKHNGWVRNVGLALLIVPISFVANMIRVIVLTLITYHLGDEAGQGFLHGFAGFVLFMSALLLMMGLDSLLRTLFPHRTTATTGGTA